MDSLYLIVKYYKIQIIKKFEKKITTFYLKLKVDTIYIKLIDNETK
jgi:hypothetical protein